MFISHQGKKPFAVDMALARGSSVSESHFQISCKFLGYFILNSVQMLCDWGITNCIPLFFGSKLIVSSYMHIWAMLLQSVRLLVMGHIIICASWQGCRALHTLHNIHYCLEVDLAFFFFRYWEEPAMYCIIVHVCRPDGQPLHFFTRLKYGHQLVVPADVQSHIVE